MHLILKYISEKLLRRGIKFDAAGLKLVSLNRIRLREASFVRQEHALNINNIQVSYSIWQSLLHGRLTGEINMKDTQIVSELISKAPFIIPNLTLSFSFGRKTKLLLAEPSNDVSLFFQLTEDKQFYDIYFESKDLSWNNLIKLFREHLQSDFLKMSYSENNSSIYARLQISKTNKDAIPLFQAKIECDDSFAIHGEDSLERIIDDKKTTTPLKDIPQALIDAVISTEDPDFYNHRGVSLPFVGYALRENLQKRKFARGASTITMQLVRNLYLSHERSVVRKLEEVIIALLLENIYHVNKEKLLESYLNIIEFAPGVYGIRDGSLHYFEKSPSELSPEEVLVLTYIIPRPAFFEEALLLKTEQLQRNLRNHIKSYAFSMYSKKLISTEEYRNLDYKIVFSKRFGELNLFDSTLIANEQKTDIAPWMHTAWSELQHWANNNLTIKDSLGYALAQKYIQITGEHFSPDSNGWCGCFVDWVIKYTNLQYDTAFSTVVLNPAFSLNYANPERYPDSCLIKPSMQKPPSGSIVVLQKSDFQGHVGFVANYIIDSGRTFVHILAGNQCDKVCVQEFEVFGERGEVKYKTKKGTLFSLLGYVYPKEYVMEELGGRAYGYNIAHCRVEEKIVEYDVA